MQFRTTVHRVHPLVVVGNDFDEGTHNVREENDAYHHDEDAANHFGVWDWEKVTIANSWECRQSKVARYDHLCVRVLDLIDAKSLQERIAIRNVFSLILLADPQVPDTAHRERDNYRNYNQTNNFEAIH